MNTIFTFFQPDCEISGRSVLRWIIQSYIKSINLQIPLNQVLQCEKPQDNLWSKIDVADNHSNSENYLCNSNVLSSPSVATIGKQSRFVFIIDVDRIMFSSNEDSTLSWFEEMQCAIIHLIQHLCEPICLAENVSIDHEIYLSIIIYPEESMNNPPQILLHAFLLNKKSRDSLCIFILKELENIKAKVYENRLVLASANLTNFDAKVEKATNTINSLPPSTKSVVLHFTSGHFRFTPSRLNSIIHHLRTSDISLYFYVFGTQANSLYSWFSSQHSVMGYLTALAKGAILNYKDMMKMSQIKASRFIHDTFLIDFPIKQFDANVTYRSGIFRNTDSMKIFEINDSFPCSIIDSIYVKLSEGFRIQEFSITKYQIKVTFRCHLDENFYFSTTARSNFKFDKCHRPILDNKVEFSSFVVIPASLQEDMRSIPSTDMSHDNSSQSSFYRDIVHNYISRQEYHEFIVKALEYLTSKKLMNDIQNSLKPNRPLFTFNHDGSSLLRDSRFSMRRVSEEHNYILKVLGNLLFSHLSFWNPYFDVITKTIRIDEDAPRNGLNMSQENCSPHFSSIVEFFKKRCDFSLIENFAFVKYSFKYKVHHKVPIMIVRLDHHGLLVTVEFFFFRIFDESTINSIANDFLNSFLVSQNKVTTDPSHISSERVNKTFSLLYNLRFDSYHEKCLLNSSSFFNILESNLKGYNETSHDSFGKLLQTAVAQTFSTLNFFTNSIFIRSFHMWHNIPSVTFSGPRRQENQSFYPLISALKKYGFYPAFIRDEFSFTYFKYFCSQNSESCWNCNGSCLAIITIIYPIKYPNSAVVVLIFVEKASGEFSFDDRGEPIGSYQFIHDELVKIIYPNVRMSLINSLLLNSCNSNKISILETESNFPKMQGFWYFNSIAKDIAQNIVSQQKTHKIFHLVASRNFNYPLIFDYLMKNFVSSYLVSSLGALELKFSSSHKLLEFIENILQIRINPTNSITNSSLNAANVVVTKLLTETCSSASPFVFCLYYNYLSNCCEISDTPFFSASITMFNCNYINNNRNSSHSDNSSSTECHIINIEKPLVMEHQNVDSFLASALEKLVSMSRKAVLGEYLSIFYHSRFFTIDRNDSKMENEMKLISSLMSLTEPFLHYEIDVTDIINHAHLLENHLKLCDQIDSSRLQSQNLRTFISLYSAGVECKNASSKSSIINERLLNFMATNNYQEIYPQTNIFLKQTSTKAKFQGVFKLRYKLRTGSHDSLTSRNISFTDIHSMLENNELMISSVQDPHPIVKVNIEVYTEGAYEENDSKNTNLCDECSDYVQTIRNFLCLESFWIQKILMNENIHPTDIIDFGLMNFLENKKIVIPIVENLLTVSPDKLIQYLSQVQRRICSGCVLQPQMYRNKKVYILRCSYTITRLQKNCQFLVKCLKSAGHPKNHEIKNESPNAFKENLHDSQYFSIFDDDHEGIDRSFSNKTDSLIDEDISHPKNDNRICSPDFGSYSYQFLLASFALIEPYETSISINHIPLGFLQKSLISLYNTYVSAIQKNILKVVESSHIKACLQNLYQTRIVSSSLSCTFIESVCKMNNRNLSTDNLDSPKLKSNGCPVIWSKELSYFSRMAQSIPQKFQNLRYLKGIEISNSLLLCSKIFKNMRVQERPELYIFRCSADRYFIMHVYDSYSVRKSLAAKHTQATNPLGMTPAGETGTCSHFLLFRVFGTDDSLTNGIRLYFERKISQISQQFSNWMLHEIYDLSCRNKTCNLLDDDILYLKSNSQAIITIKAPFKWFKEFLESFKLSLSQFLNLIRFPSRDSIFVKEASQDCLPSKFLSHTLNPSQIISLVLLELCEANSHHGSHSKVSELSLNEMGSILEKYKNQELEVEILDSPRNEANGPYQIEEYLEINAWLQGYVQITHVLDFIRHSLQISILQFITFLTLSKLNQHEVSLFDSVLISLKQIHDCHYPKNCPGFINKCFFDIDAPRFIDLYVVRICELVRDKFSRIDIKTIVSSDVSQELQQKLRNLNTKKYDPFVLRRGNPFYVALLGYTENSRVSSLLRQDDESFSTRMLANHYEHRNILIYMAVNSLEIYISSSLNENDNQTAHFLCAAKDQMKILNVWMTIINSSLDYNLGMNNLELNEKCLKTIQSHFPHIRTYGEIQNLLQSEDDSLRWQDNQGNLLHRCTFIDSAEMKSSYKFISMDVLLNVFHTELKSASFSEFFSMDNIWKSTISCFENFQNYLERIESLKHLQKLFEKISASSHDIVITYKVYQSIISIRSHFECDEFDFVDEPLTKYLLDGTQAFLLRCSFQEIQVNLEESDDKSLEVHQNLSHSTPKDKFVSVRLFYRRDTMNSVRIVEVLETCDGSLEYAQFTLNMNNPSGFIEKEPQQLEFFEEFEDEVFTDTSPLKTMNLSVIRDLLYCLSSQFAIMECLNSFYSKSHKPSNTESFESPSFRLDLVELLEIIVKRFPNSQSSFGSIESYCMSTVHEKSEGISQFVFNAMEKILKPHGDMKVYSVTKNASLSSKYDFGICIINPKSYSSSPSYFEHATDSQIEIFTSHSSSLRQNSQLVECVELQGCEVMQHEDLLKWTIYRLSLPRRVKSFCNTKNPYKAMSPLFEEFWNVIHSLYHIEGHLKDQCLIPEYLVIRSNFESSLNEDQIDEERIKNESVEEPIQKNQQFQCFFAEMENISLDNEADEKYLESCLVLKQIRKLTKLFYSKYQPWIRILALFFSYSNHFLLMDDNDDDDDDDWRGNVRSWVTENFLLEHVLRSKFENLSVEEFFEISNCFPSKKLQDLNFVSFCLLQSFAYSSGGFNSSLGLISLIKQYFPSRVYLPSTKKPDEEIILLRCEESVVCFMVIRASSCKKTKFDAKVVIFRSLKYLKDLDFTTEARHLIGDFTSFINYAAWNRSIC